MKKFGKNIEKFLKDVPNRVIESERDYVCPKCGKKITIRVGMNICPECKQEINLELQ